MNDAVADYLAAVSTGDRAAAVAVVRRLRDAGLSPLEVMNDVIAPTQLRVGELWASDAWSVAQEHAATAVSEAVLGLLGAEIPTPAESERPVIVTCVEQEWHALPALLVAEHLRAAGMPVSYLGANASAEHLVRHVHEVSARAVALSCSLGASLPRVLKQVEAVRATGTPVVLGGSAFDPHGRRAAALGATGFATSGRSAVDVVSTLPSAVPPAAGPPHDAAVEGQAIHAQREELTTRLRERLAASWGPEDLGDVITGCRRALLDHLQHLVGSLAGALVTDDRTVFDDAVVWLAEVIRHRDGPDGVVGGTVAELEVVVAEYPWATRLLKGTSAAGSR